MRDVFHDTAPLPATPGGCDTGRQIRFPDKHSNKNQKGNEMRIRKDQDDILDEEIALMAQCSDALAHPARIRIFRYIMHCNKNMSNVCNKDLVQHFDYAQATISQHVKKLVDAGLVDTKKVERYTYYFVNIGTLMKYLNVTRKFE